LQPRFKNHSRQSLAQRLIQGATAGFYWFFISLRRSGFQVLSISRKRANACGSGENKPKKRRKINYIYN
jgi:hypothetical protein